MKSTNLDRRFFESTRGKLVLLLRSRDMTVNEVAAELNLTDNAVRAHLLSLERDGLVVQKGTVKGVRKPHFIYGLSRRGADIFPKPYGLLFNRLLDSVRAALSPEAFAGRIRDIGQKLGREFGGVKGTDDETRQARALEALESLGGAAVIDKGTEGLTIRSERCPLADSVSVHPEVCQLAESMLSEILETTVAEACDRSGSPKCRFNIGAQPADGLLEEHEQRSSRSYYYDDAHGYKDYLPDKDDEDIG